MELSEDQASGAAMQTALRALEDRVRALEQNVAALGDTRQLETRITERVAAQVPRVPVAAVVEALASQPLPSAVRSLIGAASQPSTLRQVARSSWLVFDMAQELAAVGRMLFDRHYHMAWITRFVVIAFALAILTSSFWFPLTGVSWIGPVIDKLADLLLAGILFLALYCETRRYKEWKSSASGGR